MSREPTGGGTYSTFCDRCGRYLGPNQMSEECRNTKDCISHLKQRVQSIEARLDSLAGPLHKT